MIQEEKLINWSLSTDLLILETEYFDWEFRKKNKNHKCLDGWFDSGQGRWFCNHLINARKKNKNLKTKWIQNLLDSQTLQHSEMLCKLVDSIYLNPGNS